MINGSISILESEAEISKRILKALLPQVDKHFKKAFLRCENQINDILPISMLKASIVIEIKPSDVDNQIVKLLNKLDYLN